MRWSDWLALIATGLSFASALWIVWRGEPHVRFKRGIRGPETHTNPVGYGDLPATRGQVYRLEVLLTQVAHQVGVEPRQRRHHRRPLADDETLAYGISPVQGWAASTSERCIHGELVAKPCPQCGDMGPEEKKRL